MPTEEAARELLPPLAGHPLCRWSRASPSTPGATPAGVRRQLTAALVGGLDERAIDYYRLLRTLDPAAATAWYHGAVANKIYTYQELVRHLVVYDGSDGVTGPTLAKMVRNASPHAPVAAVPAVPSGPGAAARLAEVEKSHAGHAVVYRDLGRRHLADGRPDDAVRCLERWIDLSPDGRAYFDLADAYLTRGDEAKWRKTLEAFLGQEDIGLDHARARVALAEWHMAKGEYEKAEPYASAAAETYAGWALLCAARCQEGLGKWDEAEKIYRATAERYESAALDWYFASRLTGRLDPAAAEAAAREFVASLRGGVPPGDAFGVGRFLPADRPAAGGAGAARPGRPSRGRPRTGRCSPR